MIHEALDQYKLSDLKKMAEHKNCKKSGKKAEVIERIISVMNSKEKSNELSKCKCLFSTQKGTDFLKENEDLILYHKEHYDISVEDFFLHRFVGNRRREFYDTAFQALSEKAYAYELKKYYSRLEMIYWNISTVCYNEGRYDISLQNALYRLYFSTNLAGKTYLFSGGLIEFNGIENMAQRINAYEVFNKHTVERIIELCSYFQVYMIEVIYAKQILPYCIFDKVVFDDAIYDMFNQEIFDAELYCAEIREKYKQYMSKFI